MKKNKFPRAMLTIWDLKGKMRQIYYTTRFNRLYHRIRHGSWAKIYIKVEYGKQEDVFGKKIMFYNDGTYEKRKEALQALHAFLEK